MRQGVASASASERRRRVTRFAARSLQLVVGRGVAPPERAKRAQAALAVAGKWHEAGSGLSLGFGEKETGDPVRGQVAQAVE
jgi:hypothetical protein